MNKEKIIIDTDPGVDDAMAILFAIAHPDIELVGLTTIFGNVTIDIATRNALGLCELANVNIPVAHGAKTPLIQPSKEVAWEVHGREGFGTVPPMSPTTRPDDRPAHEFICDMVNEYPNEITLCPVGPLTNIALALQHDPAITEKVKGVTVMGGSVDEGGNVTPHAEANIWQDPHAAEEVFSTNWPVKMIGLDVTHRIICSPEDFSTLPPAAPVLGRFLNEAVQFYIEFHQKVDAIRGCHMHDPAAVLSIINPALFSFDDMPLDVIVEGEEIGRTKRSSDTQKPKVKVALKVDETQVKSNFLNTIKSSF